ncbi:uncharacterized protein PV07_04437 [Cladophialophora immunda]|uniref:Uncharacterized protein n=1 Tax=Cladophialophora immunda TaxID=569365 RepID=A0A0D2DB57_9EURO|nr:uncharacterized protein PV07_04437 [Cladophialophora immunda]KIW32924.1 hypothetical protein PV07_04437 [Cladophialophora immunda]
MAYMKRLFQALKDNASTSQVWHSLGRSHDKQEESNKETQDVQPVGLTLSSLSREFSFAAYLSPRPVENQAQLMMVIFNEQPLDATYLVLLALNEECRRMQRGCFYYLPLRQEVSKGHPCDMVFIDEPWGAKSVRAWDASSWDTRLSMCAAEGKIDPHEHVIPVCSRILKFDLSEPAKTSGRAHVYASNSDPAVAKHANIQTWSRPLKDVSRILIVYAHHHVTPTISHLHAVEHASQCTTFPTPNDLSLTAVPNWQETTSAVFGRKSNVDAPKSSARPNSSVKVAGDAEVVLALLRIWNRGCVSVDLDKNTDTENISNGLDLNLGVFDDWEVDFGCTKLLWQGVEDRVYNHTLDVQEAMLRFWPKE